MKNIIKIDEVEYIKKSKYDLLEKKKEKIVIKKVKTEPNMKEYMIFEGTKVAGILPIKQERDDEDNIKTFMGLFKRVEKPNVISKYNDEYNIDVININGSKYSKDYFDKFKKMASEFYVDVPEIFMMFDKDKNEFLKNSPILFLFGENMAFVLAPRIETEDD